MLTLQRETVQEAQQSTSRKARPCFDCGSPEPGAPHTALTASHAASVTT